MARYTRSERAQYKKSILKAIEDSGKKMFYIEKKQKSQGTTDTMRNIRQNAFRQIVNNVGDTMIQGDLRKVSRIRNYLENRPQNSLMAGIRYNAAAQAYDNFYDRGLDIASFINRFNGDKSWDFENGERAALPGFDGYGNPVNAWRDGNYWEPPEEYYRGDAADIGFQLRQRRRELKMRKSTGKTGG